MFPAILFFFIICNCSQCFSNDDIDLNKTIVWGPGLNPSKIVLPARYFFVQFVDKTGQNITSKPSGNLDVHIGHLDRTQKCRVWTQILDRNDGSYIIRYKMYHMCSGLQIDLRFKNNVLPNFPLLINERIFPDDCNCPHDLYNWKKEMNCLPNYRQINEDLSKFAAIDMDKIRSKVIEKFNKRGSMSICHFVILNNNIHRTCYGQYVGFHIFMDAMLLSIARKVKLPDIEFFVNLGDWPLEQSNSNPLPVFSWCGSDKTDDIVMPTYDIAESTLECMGRVQLDMLSVQGNTGPSWPFKKEQAFWRGRDSREERLILIDIARKHPSLFNASLTNFFFFRDREKEYGPKVPHVSFFDFFKYKYQICIDGSVAAYRLPYLLAGGSLVFKQESPYYEHFYKDLKPGEHYLQVSRNLSDLVEKIEVTRVNDENAYKIAKAGASFARENLMPSNIFCYYAVLFEEWGKRLKSTIKVLPEMELVPQIEPSEKCDCEPRHLEL